jgi:hypothetical protein
MEPLVTYRTYINHSSCFNKFFYVCVMLFSIIAITISIIAIVKINNFTIQLNSLQNNIILGVSSWLRNFYTTNKTITKKKINNKFVLYKKRSFINLQLITNFGCS